MSLMHSKTATSMAAGLALLSTGCKRDTAAVTEVPTATPVATTTVDPLAQLATSISNQFAAHGANMDNKFATQNARIDALAGKVEEQGNAVRNIEGRLTALGNDFAGITNALASLRFTPSAGVTVTASPPIATVAPLVTACASTQVACRGKQVDHAYNIMFADGKSANVSFDFSDPGFRKFKEIVDINVLTTDASGNVRQDTIATLPKYNFRLLLNRDTQRDVISTKMVTGIMNGKTSQQQYLRGQIYARAR